MFRKEIFTRRNLIGAAVLFGVVVIGSILLSISNASHYALTETQLLHLDEFVSKKLGADAGAVTRQKPYGFGKVGSKRKGFFTYATVHGATSERWRISWELEEGEANPTVTKIERN